MTMTRYVRLQDIRRRPDARAIDRENLERIKRSIVDVGLLSPVVVRGIDGDGYELIAGNHRFIATQELGDKDILAIEVGDIDDLLAEMTMIDENLVRSELTPSDRAKQTARRKAIYLELHPETAAGAAGAEARWNAADNLSTASFATETSKATGRDERTVRRDAERGEKVIDAVLDMIRGTRLDTGTYLDKIKRLPPNEQVTAAKRDLSLDKAQAKSERLARQAENDAARDQTRKSLSPEVQAQQQAKAEAIAARKAAPVDIEALTAELEEVREANAALEADVARLTEENKLYAEMKVQFEQGGFAKVIAGKDKVIEGLETRVYRESADKASWMKLSKFWEAEAKKLGFSRNAEIDIETGEVTNG